VTAPFKITYQFLGAPVMEAGATERAGYKRVGD